MILFRVLLIFMCNFSLVFAESANYESMENQGLNKSEKLEKVDRVLSQMSANFKSLEAKIDEQVFKIKKIEDTVNDLKRDVKKITDESGKKADDVLSKKNVEIEKLKNEFESFKSEEFAKLKFDLDSIVEKVNSLYYKNKK